MPAVVDDASGAVRFRIVVDKNGHIESVVPVSSSVSKRQEELCREALLKVAFERTGTSPGQTTGYYTFTITVR
ncbi:hypothetical protein JAO73_09980 [Hymenobacter sp. BT523]|uniref:hypothetical protein n=1 Tax=Hymenobacter sp. BT523 TaxID=2795725 RepID=UPI0018EC5438|nr:hypothetical protein [Hymenobacter sp. BT523]MBJ6109342.1 hypothetical protein [Hymenobacter sp. BT523]